MGVVENIFRAPSPPPAPRLPERRPEQAVDPEVLAARERRRRGLEDLRINREEARRGPVDLSTGSRLGIGISTPGDR